MKIIYRHSNIDAIGDPRFQLSDDGQQLVREELTTDGWESRPLDSAAEDILCVSLKQSHTIKGPREHRVKEGRFQLAFWGEDWQPVLTWSVENGLGGWLRNQQEAIPVETRCLMLGVLIGHLAGLEHPH